MGCMFNRLLHEGGQGAPGVGKKLSRDIKKVQKIAINIILGDHFLTYEQSCTKLGLKPLYIRRNQLCEKFAVETVLKSRPEDLFQQECQQY